MTNVEIFKEVQTIKEFANIMKYDYKEFTYEHYNNHRPCFCIELINLHYDFDDNLEDCSKAWYLDTGEEII